MERRFLGKTTEELRKIPKSAWNEWYEAMIQASGYEPREIPAYKCCWCCKQYSQHNPSCRNPWDVGHWIPEHKEVAFYGWEPRIWWPLSNFYKLDNLIVNGRKYPTSEHLYQANKALDVDEHERIRNQPTPQQAKNAGRSVKLAPDWEIYKRRIMYEVLRAKFALPELKIVLLGTGFRPIHEENPNDAEWSYLGGRGKDLLGLCLMDIRSELARDIIESGVELFFLGPQGS